ncbi:MAG: toprim domain-containing protein [Chloroflexia bacterium]
MSPYELASAIGGEFRKGWFNIPAPGHSSRDRSLGFQFDPSAPGGLRIHTFSRPGISVCRAHIEALLNKFLAGGSITLEVGSLAQNENRIARGIASAQAIWNEAAPIKGTIAEAYLNFRGCQVSEAIIAAASLRFHPHCIFGYERYPAMVALMRNVATGQPSGIHRTALKDDGTGKRTLPEGKSAKMMMGTPKGSAVMLMQCSTILGISEGIESGLSASQLFGIPVWATMSAKGIADFPVIYGLKHLTVFADHDPVGLAAARSCGGTYKEAGIEGQIRCPPKNESDWNSYMKDNKWDSNL